MLKKRITDLIELLKKRPAAHAARAILFVAFFAFASSCYLYWVSNGGQGLRDGSMPMSRAAQAEGMRKSAEVLAAVLAKEAESASAAGFEDHIRANSAGHTQGGLSEPSNKSLNAEDEVTKTAEQASSQRDADLAEHEHAGQGSYQPASVGQALEEALSEVLNRVYPELAESGYFVLWRGTVAVCSPLTPDTSGLDFGAERDARGVYFVQELDQLAKNGGGFFDFVLSYEKGKKGGQSLESQFVAYVTPVQGTDLHLTLWRPVQGRDFSLQADLQDGGSHWSLLGLCMSGLSFLGVSVVLRSLKE